MELITTPTHDAQREETEQEEKSTRVERKIEKGRGVTDTWGPRTAGRPFANHECIPMIVILHLGSHSGRGHPICSPFSKGVPLFNPGRLNAPARPQAFSTTKKNTQTQHRTHRHSNHTHTPPEQRRPLAPSPPPSLPLLVRWLLWERTDVVKAGCMCVSVCVCESTYVLGMYCTVSE